MSKITRGELSLQRNTRMKNKLKYFGTTFLLLIALSIAFERQAYAYVDPGSGLLIFQGISAVVSGVLFYFRQRIKSLFSRGKRRDSVAADATLVQPISSRQP